MYPTCLLISAVFLGVCSTNDLRTLSSKFDVQKVLLCTMNEVAQVQYTFSTLYNIFSLPLMVVVCLVNLTLFIME